MKKVLLIGLVETLGELSGEKKDSSVCIEEITPYKLNQIANGLLQEILGPIMYKINHLQLNNKKLKKKK